MAIAASKSVTAGLPGRLRRVEVSDGIHTNLHVASFIITSHWLCPARYRPNYRRMLLLGSLELGHFDCGS